MNWKRNSRNRKKKNRVRESDIKVWKDIAAKDCERLRRELNFRLMCDAELTGGGRMLWVEKLETEEQSAAKDNGFS